MKTAATGLDFEDLIRQVSVSRIDQQLARNSLLNFIQYTFDHEYDTNWHHKLVCDLIDRWIRPDSGLDRLILSMPPRHGKALHVDTPIPTPDGWKKISELRAGDQVFDEHGQPCGVVAVSGVFKDRPVYRVTTDDGHQIIADENHQWNVQLCRKRKVISTRATGWLWDRRRKMNDYRKPLIRKHGALRLPDKDLLIDPYLLGVWLGDGRAAYGFITSGDTGDRQFVRDEIERAGYTTRSHADVKNFGVMGLHKLLRKLGVENNKHIPDVYMWSGQGQRLALLQGLIDSDGHVAPDGQIEFCSIDRQLATDVQQLVHSLGYKASLITGSATIDGRYISEKYRVMFYMPNAASIPRKRDRCRTVKRLHRYIDVQPAGTADTVCIQVDSPSRLFLCGKAMLPTHNSEIVSRRLPPYIFGKFPDVNVMAITYGDTLSNDMNRDVQRVMDDNTYRAVFPQTRLPARRGKTEGNERRNMDMLEIVGRRGKYISSGIMGGVTGKGTDYLIIDDPIKNMEEALSPTIRDKVFLEYSASLTTRLESGAKVLITMTRWHPEDLVGRVLEMAEKDPDADQWHVVQLPAVCTDPHAEYEQRQQGEPLWENKKDLPALKRIKSTVPSLVWSALYQQNPTPESGEYWTKDHIRKIKREHLPPLSNIRTYWDTAYTENEANSASAWIRCGVFNRNLYVIDAGHIYAEFPKLIKTMKAKEAPHKIEAKASGKSAKQVLSANGVSASEVDVQADKIARTNDVLPHGEAGRIHVCEDLYDYVMNDTKQGIIFLSAKNPDIDLNDALTMAIKDQIGGALTDWELFADDPDLQKERTRH